MNSHRDELPRTLPKFAVKNILKFSRFNDTHKQKVRFTQFSTSMAAWLLLTFLVCLYNQLSSTHSVITIKEYRCLKNIYIYIFSITVKINDSSFQQVLRQNLVGFCLNTGKRFFLEVSF